MGRKSRRSTPSSASSPIVSTIVPPSSTRRGRTPRNKGTYNPPNGDDIDQLVNKVDQGGSDKYRPVAANRVWSNATSQLSSSGITTNYGNDESQFADSRMTSPSMESDDPFSIVSESETENSRQPPRLLVKEQERKQTIEDLYQLLEDSDYYSVKQKFGYLSIAITAVQILVLMVQLTLCGVAPLDVNPFVGPYPDAVSEWGGKNTYLMKAENQYWRLITPAFLHVGVIHLLINGAIQLETCAFFEREWGSMKYLSIYVIGELGCIMTSASANPETLAVGSSGALMSLFGAKLAQVLTQVLFDSTKPEDDAIRIEQLSAVMCCLAVVFILSFFTYIDWSGHMGGMAAGFAFGILAFAKPIRSVVSRTLWRLLGLLLLGGGFGFVTYYYLEFVEGDQELGDPCEYFRNLFAEGYDCTCKLFG